MNKIIKIETTDEEGHTKTWTGSGTVVVVKTKTPDDNLPKLEWPDLTYVTITLVIKQ
jgi:hypothetical protein